MPDCNLTLHCTAYFIKKISCPNFKSVQYSISPHVRSKGQADLINIGFRTTFVDEMCIVFLAVMFNNSKKHTYITLRSIVIPKANMSTLLSARRDKI